MVFCALRRGDLLPYLDCRELNGNEWDEAIKEADDI